MSRGPLSFKQSDIVRAVRAAQAAGLEVVRTEIHTDGRIVLVHTVDSPVQREETFEEWEARSEQERRPIGISLTAPHHSLQKVR